MVLALFGQVLRISDPVAGFASAGRFVVVQFAVQGLDQLDAFPERGGQRIDRHVLELAEVLKASFPAAILASAVTATFARCCKQALVLVIVLFDQSLDEEPGVSKRFYEFLSHIVLQLVQPPASGYDRYDNSLVALCVRG